MDQLLDEMDSLPHPDLAALAGNWCESCETLRQELKRLQDDQVQNFSKLKQKIISTDLLIKKYKTKCDDYDNQSKRLEETTRRLEKAQRQSETLELQLKSSLLETEPLRKSKYNLEVELRTKNAEVEDAVNKMVCAQGLQQQIQGENKYLQEQVDKLEAEKRELKEKVHSYKLKEKDGDTVKHLKVEVASLKREISGLKRENVKQLKKEQSLETKLQETLEKMNHYCNMLKQHKLLTAAKKSLPHHRSPGKSHTTSDSDVSFDGGKDSSLLHKDIRKSIEETESSSDDDGHSVFQVPWAFSPIVKCLSPLPPSPACFAQKQSSLEEDDDEDNEYLSDLAEELEHQLMDIFSEDEITEVNKTNKLDSQDPENSYDNGDLAAFCKGDDSELNSGAERGVNLLEDLTENMETDTNADERSQSAILDTKSEKLGNLEEMCNGSQAGTDNEDVSLSAELAQAANISDSVCKDILDSIVNEILGDTVSEVQEQEVPEDINIEQTVYCDDTTLISTPVRKSKSDLKSKSVDKDDIEKDTDSQDNTSDTDTFKSPKSLKERLRDASWIISPVCTRRRSADKLSKSGSKASPCHKKSESVVSEDTDSKGSLDNAQNNKCSENISDQKSNLNRSDTGEFSPALHEVESPSSVSKEKSGFFISGEEITFVHSIRNLSSPVNNNDSNSANGSNETKTKDFNDNMGSPKHVLKRQIALRKDSASDMVPDKKVCSKTDDTSQSSVMGTRRTTRSKSMPDKYIKFQKGTCETLSEEIAKFDVSKGGYNKGDKTVVNEVKATEVSLEHIQDKDAEMETNESDSREEEKSIQKKVKQNDTPIAKRTRRSSRLQSLPEKNNEKGSKRSAASKIIPSKDKPENMDSAEKEKITNDSANNVKRLELQENNEKKSENDNVLIEDSKVSEDEQRNIETENSDLQTEKNKDVLHLDFRGDSIKSASENISETLSSEINIGNKGEVHESSPNFANFEDIGVKATPSRQISTGFQLHSPQGSDKQKEHISPIRLKETIIEENENVTDNVDSVNDGPSVILDVNDIFNDSVIENVVVKETDKRTNRDSVKDDKLSSKDTLVDNSLIQDVGDNENKVSEIEDATSPIALPIDIVQSAKQNVTVTEETESGTSSPASWLEPGTSGSNLIESRSGSATPDNFSVDDMPVLSPLPMSPFEMVDLISPLPPTPTPMDEPLSPLAEDEDADKTLTEDNALKSPEASDRMPDIAEFSTPESKPPAKMEKIQFTPLPAMLSPIITPKRLKTADSAISKDIKVSDSTPKPCQFISEVPTGISVKPKPVHASDLNEPVTQKQNTDIEHMETELSKDNTSPSHKENVVPNTNSQQSIKTKILKTAVSKTAINNVEISKISAKDKVTKAVVVLDKLVIDQHKEKQGSIPSKSSEMKKTPGDSDNISTETKSSNVVPEISGGYDNLVASKTKLRQAHQPKVPRLPVKKPIPIIEAPVLLPVNRKRKSTEAVKEKDKEVEEKKPCKEHVFKRRQKNESKTKTAVSKFMQNFLKSSDPPASVISKLESEQGEDEEEGSPEQRAVKTCFDCLSRIRNDTLEAVHESCTTDDYLNVIDDWPYLFPVEKQAVELCWHVTHGEKQTMTKASVMEELWTRIFSSEQGTSISGKKSLARMFTALCVKAGNLEEVRVLYYNIVVCGYLNSPSFLVPIISVWPETLRREDDEDHGMVIVLEHVLMQLLKSQDNATSKQIKDCAVKLCNWTEEQEKAEIVLANLLKKLEKASDLGKVYELRKGIELLIVKEGSDWFYKSFVNPHLQRLANKWMSKGRKCGLTSLYVCNVLKIAGTFLSQFHEKQKLFNDAIRHWVLPILRKEPSCPEVRECCIELILEVSCYNPKMLNNLQGWYYHFKGSVRPELEHRMETLRTEYNTKFATLINPFVRKFKPMENW